MPIFAGMTLKREEWIDLGVCLVLIPALAGVFPIEDWAAWRSGDVVVYLLWTYLCWYLGRHVLPGLFQKGKGLKWTGIALLLLTAVLTFLMSIRPVPFPREVAAEKPPRLYLYQQAAWVLYLAALALGLTTGLLMQKIRRLEQELRDERLRQATRTVMETRAVQAVSGETVTVKSDYRDVNVPLAAVRFIEARNNYACIHLDHQEDILSQIPMKTLLEMLPEGKFVRIHRSYIIPVHRIESKKATSVKLAGVEEPLPVGRAYKENLK